MAIGLASPAVPTTVEESIFEPFGSQLMKAISLWETLSAFL
jgi:hypothetical protein